MPSQRSCSILTISSSTVQGKNLAERLISVSDSANPVASVDAGKGTTLELPWTISNKYYTALVHFSITETKHVKAEDAIDVPACIFVFSVAESFRNDFTSLMSRLEKSDFEVSIAISVSAGLGAGQLTEEEQDDIEEFFGEHGFEYVNGQSAPNMSQEHDIDDLEGVPGIGRLVDALSTILWPSMVQNAGSRRAKARSVVSVPGPPGEDDGLRALLNTDTDTSTNIGLQREMDALEKWLEEGADDEKDPWAGQVFESRPKTHQEFDASARGFDDNFSDFVSATAQSNEGATEIDDPELPSQAEITSMSEQIFSMASTDGPEEGDSQAPFDLSRVLGALEAMKEEIAGITDDDEKRKAAAKVALGLVYGLEEG